jgi:hypothetical protein
MPNLFRHPTGHAPAKHTALISGYLAGIEFANGMPKQVRHDLNQLTLHFRDL